MKILIEWLWWKYVATHEEKITLYELRHPSLTEDISPPKSDPRIIGLIENK